MVFFFYLNDHKGARTKEKSHARDEVRVFRQGTKEIVLHGCYPFNMIAFAANAAFAAKKSSDRSNHIETTLQRLYDHIETREVSLFV